MKWISVKRKLPEDGEDVFVCYEYISFGKPVWRYGCGFFDTKFHDTPVFEVDGQGYWELDGDMFWAQLEPPGGDE